MAFPKGEKRPAGAGRKKGTPNRTTATLKEMVLGALDQAGGEKYLIKQAHDEPRAFLALVGKVLPLQVTGDGGGAIRITWDKSE